MKNAEKFYGLYYDERLENIVIAKDLFFKSLAPLRKKHRDVYTSYHIDGESKGKIAKKFGYTLESVPVTASKIGGKVKTNLNNLYKIRE